MTSKSNKKTTHVTVKSIVLGVAEINSDTHQLMKAIVLAESSNYLSTFIVMSAPAMPTDSSQVGAAIFPSF